MCFPVGRVRSRRTHRKIAFVQNMGATPGAPKAQRGSGDVQRPGTVGSLHVLPSLRPSPAFCVSAVVSDGFIQTARKMPRKIRRKLQPNCIFRPSSPHETPMNPYRSGSRYVIKIRHSHAVCLLEHLVKPSKESGFPFPLKHLVQGVVAHPSEPLPLPQILFHRLGREA